jgi:DNA-binding transcriptional regulator GbsR (MarR family)
MSATHRFIDYFGELGPRWGLPSDACRVHAHLYLVARPAAPEEITATLPIDAASLAQAVMFLTDYGLIAPVARGGWRTSSDPWDMLVRGLDERRRRELPVALATLRECHREALADTTRRPLAGQIGKLLALVEDLAALDAQAQRFSPQLVRGLVGVSGRAARFIDRALRTRKGETP